MLELIGLVILAGVIIGTISYFSSKEETPEVKPEPTPEPEMPKTRPEVAKVRARTETGKFKADDPSTPDVNEAWKGGKKPRKPRQKKE